MKVDIKSFKQVVFICLLITFVYGKIRFCEKFADENNKICIACIENFKLQNDGRIC